MPTTANVIIVGAGVSGLSAAITLQQAGISTQLLDAADTTGGRVSTSTIDGFLLDEGFQVLLTAYPEAQHFLDYDALGLKSFASGARIWHGNRWHTVADPLRHPQHALSSLLAPIGTWQDKLNILRLRQHVNRGSVQQLLQPSQNATSSLAFLQAFGFSNAMIQQFFRPFYSGIFLEPNLATDACMLKFTYRMFSSGYAAIPKNGMAAIAKQLSQALQPNSFVPNQPVQQATKNSVVLANGQSLSANAVILATDPWQAATLLNPATQTPPTANSTTCLYFKTKQLPSHAQFLHLNGSPPTDATPINHVCFPSAVQASYAPEGWHLVSVSLIGVHQQPNIKQAVLNHAKQWFGNQADSWEHLKTCIIANALPSLMPNQARLPQGLHSSGVYLCGDGCTTPSLNGAMASGKAVANTVI